MPCGFYDFSGRHKTCYHTEECGARNEECTCAAPPPVMLRNAVAKNPGMDVG